MKLLITSDLHLTDHIDDEYRFRIFTWLEKAVVRHHLDYIVVLGDLTETKDRHSAMLVNRIADVLRSLADQCPVVILKGNHDYVDPETPFFRFLDFQSPSLQFIYVPAEILLGDKKALFLPHTAEHVGYKGEYDFADYDYIFVHQTFHGARGENGRSLAGMQVHMFSNTDARIYSGDVHVPQRIGRVEYVGAPYHIHFGDPFVPRVILDDGQSVQEITLKTVRKLSASIYRPEQLEDVKMRAGDQIKVELKLFRSEFSEWDDYARQIKTIAKKAQVRLCGLRLVERQRQRIRLAGGDRREYLSDPQRIFDNYCSKNAERIGNKLKAAGAELL